MTTKGLFALTVAMLLGQAGHAWAQGSPQRTMLQPNLAALRTASLDEPLVLGRAESSRPGPTWTNEGIWPSRPAGLRGLQKIDGATVANDPVWDPSSQAWYAFAYGALVRVEADGRLPVVLANLPGHDFDVRAARGRVVCRDLTRDQIVLLTTGSGSAPPRVLLERGGFYNPRFSPDGSQILVSQLKNGGGHLWLVSTETGAARDLGAGYEPAWRPDGKQALFVRTEDDGERLTASTLVVLDPASGAVRTLAAPRGHIVTRPAFSPDGLSIAFVDAQSLQLMAARLPVAGGAR